MTNMQATYFDDLPFSEDNRVVYCFPKELALQISGIETAALVGLATKNGNFETLSAIGTPNNAEIKTFNFGNKQIEAVMFDTAPLGAFQIDFNNANYNTLSAFSDFIKPKLASGNSTVINNFSSNGNIVYFDLAANTSIPSSAFGETADVINVIDSAGQITAIGDYCFGSSYIVSVNLPSVTEIPVGAFSYCDRLTDATFGAVTDINTTAFAYCTILQTPTFFDKVVTIGTEAFLNCTTIDYAVCPLLETIGSSGFKGCTALEGFAFDVLQIFENNVFENCTALFEPTANNALEVKHSAFKGCTSAYIFPFDIVQNIGDSAFEGCTTLNNVHYTAVTTVGARVFHNCSALEVINIESATSVGNNCFNGCTSCTQIRMNSVTSCGNNSNNNGVFDNMTYIGLAVYINSAIASDLDITQIQSAGANVFY